MMSDKNLTLIDEKHVFINANISEELDIRPEVFCCFLADFEQGKKCALFSNKCIKVTSGNAINVLSIAIATVSFLVSKEVMRCQMDDRTCHFFSRRQIISYNKGTVMVNLLSIR